MRGLRFLRRAGWDRGRPTVSFRSLESCPASRKINHRGQEPKKTMTLQTFSLPLDGGVGVRSVCARIRGCDHQAGCAQCAVRNQMMRVAPNRISIPSMTLTWPIYTACGEGRNTLARVTGGADWVNRTAYAVEGLATEPATLRQLQEMLRTLLEDRFAWKIHRTQIRQRIRFGSGR